MISAPRTSLGSPFLGKAPRPERLSRFSINSTYNSPGPYKPQMHFWPQRISTSTLPAEVQSTTRARDRTVKAKVWYPTKAAKGPDVPTECPLVLFTNGFRMLSEFYTEYAEHLASWGYVAGQYDLITCKEPASLFELVDDATLVDYFKMVRPTVKDKLQDLKVPIYIPEDQLGVAGHSRGGKVSALIGTDYTNVVKSMFLIDPVDNVKIVQPPSPEYPSALEALKDGNFQLGIAGSSVCGFCNPTPYDYQKFYEFAAKGSWLVKLPRAGHMQFLSACWPVQIALNLLCFFGATTNKKVIPLTKAFMVAWFEMTLKTELPPESRSTQYDENDKRMEEFLEWAKKEQVLGDIEFETKK